MQVEVTTFGEAMLRMSTRTGDRLEDAERYDVHIAGSEANVAYALARIGITSQWVSALPDTALGDRVERTLRAGGVRLDAVQRLTGARLGTYFVELSVPPRPTRVVYDRAGSAFALASADAFDWELVCAAKLLHVTGISFAVSPLLAHRALQEARLRGLTTSLDINYRRHLSSEEAAAAVVERIAEMLDLLICRLEDARDLFQVDGDAEAAAVALRERLAIETVVVTDGSVGAVAVDATGVLARPAYPVSTIIDPVGAGDAFAAGVISGLLERSLAEGLERGLAMAALKMTLHGDLFRLGRAEVDSVRNGNTRQIIR